MVMLGGLLAIPAVALFGAGFPETVRQIIQRHFPLNSVSSAASFPEAPLFVPAAGPGPAPGLAPPTVSMPAPVPAAQQVMAPTAPDPFAAPPLAAGPPSPVVPTCAVCPTAQAVVAAVACERATATPLAQARQPNPPEHAITSIYENPANLVPVVRATDAAPSVPADDSRLLMALQETAEVERAVAGRDPAASDRFAVLQSQLRQWGATYCRLESCGPRVELYRFYCKMGIAGSTNFTRCFEATDADPMTAVAKVVADVEQWRARLASRR